MHLQDKISEPSQGSEIDLFYEAAALLGAMMRELQGLVFDSGRLTLLIATSNLEIQQRLRVLSQTIDSLSATHDALRSAELAQRAKALIVRLFGQIEKLASHVESEYK